MVQKLCKVIKYDHSKTSYHDLLNGVGLKKALIGFD